MWLSVNSTIGPSSALTSRAALGNPSSNTAIESFDPGAERAATELIQRRSPTGGRRASPEDCRMGPKVPRSTVLSAEEELLIVACRRHTLLPLDDCLYALQATVPHLTRSSLHRLFQRQGVSRLPSAEGTRVRRKFHAIRSGTSTSISRRSGRTKAGSISSLPSIASAIRLRGITRTSDSTDRGGLPATARRTCAVPHSHGPYRQRVSIHAAGWRLDVDEIQQLLAAGSPFAPMPLTWPAPSSASSIASPNSTTRGRTAKSNG